MRALGTLFCQPSANANITTQLGAMRAEMSIPQLLHTNEAAENLCQSLE
jgi:hypothetical protein